MKREYQKNSLLIFLLLTTFLLVLLLIKEIIPEPKELDKPSTTKIKETLTTSETSTTTTVTTTITTTEEIKPATSLENISKETVLATFKDKRALVVGDSFAEGLSAYKVLEEVNVIWHRGRRISDIDSDISGINAYNPTYLFLAFGTNDLEMWGENIQTFANIYKEKILYLKSLFPNTQIIINLITPSSSSAIEKNPNLSYYQDYNNKLIEISNELNIPYIDNSEFLKLKENPYSTDGIHPKAFFFTYWGKNMTKYLLEN